MTAENSVTLFTAIGVFDVSSDLRIHVAVPNFPAQQEAQDYAQAFRIKLADGVLLRDDGKGSGLFDENSREVLDSDVTVTQRQSAASDQYQPIDMPIAQLSALVRANGEFNPVAWHVE
jgi:hypothetical protein